MATETTRRDMLKTSLAAAGVGLLGDAGVGPAGAGPGRNGGAVCRLARELQPEPGAGSPTVRHANHRRRDDAEGSVLHHAALRASGRRPGHLSPEGVGPGQHAGLACRSTSSARWATPSSIAGFECSGNRRPLQGLIGNGRWTGVPLKTVLEKAGLKDNAREIVFFGADKGPEEVEFRAQKFNVEQQYGRSMPRDKALSHRRRSSPTRSTASRSRGTRDRRCACSSRAGTARRT